MGAVGPSGPARGCPSPSTRSQRCSILSFPAKVRSSFSPLLSVADHLHCHVDPNVRIVAGSRVKDSPLNCLKQTRSNPASMSECSTLDLPFGHDSSTTLLRDGFSSPTLGVETLSTPTSSRNHRRDHRHVLRLQRQGRDHATHYCSDGLETMQPEESIPYPRTLDLQGNVEQCSGGQTDLFAGRLVFLRSGVTAPPTQHEEGTQGQRVVVAPVLQRYGT